MLIIQLKNLLKYKKIINIIIIRLKLIVTNNLIELNFYKLV